MTMRFRPKGSGTARLVVALSLLLAGCAAIRGQREPATASAEPEGKVKATAEKAVGIATQPVRDVGVAKPEIPDVLVRATQAPYSLESTRTCGELRAAITALNEHLGDDYRLAGEKDESKTGKVAEAGAKAIVNSIIPFRGLVRELTGAAKAERRYEDAIDAGYARRGFLRGIEMTKACPRAS